QCDALIGGNSPDRLATDVTGLVTKRLTPFPGMGAGCMICCTKLRSVSWRCRPKWLALVVMSLAGLIVGSSVRGAEPVATEAEPSSRVSFHRDIRPLFQVH